MNSYYLSYKNVFPCNKLKNRNEILVLLGDLNYPEIDWLTESCNKKETHIASIFLKTIQQNFLTQVIHEKTHYRPNQNPTLIDLIITRDSDDIYNIEYFPPLGKSHHVVLQFELNIMKTKNMSLGALKYQYANIVKMER